MDSKQIESAVYRARALIIWGKPREKAVELLKAAGLSDDKIEEVLRISMKERGRAIRKKGVWYLLIGLIVIPASIAVGIFTFPRGGGARRSNFRIMLSDRGIRDSHDFSGSGAVN